MTRFERYPGPPGGEPGLHRVISPWRDALAWVSIAGPLRVAQILVRAGDGWRATIPPPAMLDTVDATPRWTLDHRDPVELVFACTHPGITGTASVTVTRDACKAALELRNDGERDLSLAEVAVWEGGEVVVLGGAPCLRPGEGGSFVIRIPAA